MKNIVVIDNFDSFVYNLVRYVRETESVATVSVYRNNEVNYDALAACDGILLSPGPGVPEEAGDLLNVIEKYAATKKILGVCLGHQAIAEAFGGILQPCSRPVHGKASTIRLTENDSLFASLPDRFEVGRYHSWQVAANPEMPLRITATTTDDGVIMAIRHRHYAVAGIQFHPESILTPYGRKIIENWVNE
ncbi:MAG: aminodeoxychorismate/anthranilate synthase component II [Edaphocola sp.]